MSINPSISQLIRPPIPRSIDPPNPPTHLDLLLLLRAAGAIALVVMTMTARAQTAAVGSPVRSDGPRPQLSHVLLWLACCALMISIQIPSNPMHPRHRIIGFGHATTTTRTHPSALGPPRPRPPAPRPPSRPSSPLAAAASAAANDDHGPAQAPALPASFCCCSHPPSADERRCSTRVCDPAPRFDRSIPGPPGSQIRTRPVQALRKRSNEMTGAIE